MGKKKKKKSIFIPITEWKIKSENSKLGRRPQEPQVWKGPTEPLSFFSFLAPTYNCVFSSFSFDPALCFLEPNGTFCLWLQEYSLSLITEALSCKSYAHQLCFKTKSLQKYYQVNTILLKCKLYLSRKIYLHSQYCGHFSCSDSCQPDCNV